MSNPYDDLPDVAGAAGAGMADYISAELELAKGKPHTLYQRYPVDWMVDKLGMKREDIVWSMLPAYERHTWDGTVDPLVIALDALAAWRWVACEAGTATSKTYTLGAAGMLWFLACFEDSIVLTIAPKEDQLTKNLWKEAGDLWERFQPWFPDATLTHLSIKMRGAQDEKWAATGLVSGVGADEDAANRARGFHAEHMLWIVEEGPGVHQAIWNPIKNTSKAPHNLIMGLGNPDHVQDPLHKFSLLKRVVPVRISQLDFPNVVVNDVRDPEKKDLLGDVQLIPGGASRQGIEDFLDDYGHDSPMFQRMVRGIAPSQRKNALIRWEWCERAATHYGDPAFKNGPPALGVDVANSETGDEAAKAFWTGAHLDEVQHAQCPDASVLGTEVAVEIALRAIDPINLGVDSVGVGASTVNKLKELGVYGQWLNGGTRAWPEVDDSGQVPVRKEELYVNLRCQMWWKMAQDLRRDLVAIPADEELWRDLCTPKYEIRSGRIWVESKEEIFETLRRSPDRGDSAVYGNWVRTRTIVHEQEAELDAWDPEVLVREAEECRRIVQTRPTLHGDLIHPEFGQLL